MHKTKFIAGIFLLMVAYANPTLVTKAEMSTGNASTAPLLAQDITQTLHLKVTAYASVPDETSDHPFITASGARVHDGVVATNLLPFGTKVEIPSLFGNKIFTVEDRMNKRMKENIDIWMSTKAKAVVFGAHYANIDVLAQDQNNGLSLIK